jgi:chromosome segregation ATPase
MAMREDKAELRARCYALEREKASLDLRLSGHEAQRQAQGAALSSLQQQLRDSESRLSGSFQVCNISMFMIYI